MHNLNQYDVIVVGAGHAGIEAALAAARLGARTAVFTVALDAVGNMPCNPSIGGTAKGHLVFELDALGGEMGRAADATALQSRMLNLAKGPAVHSLRMQNDRRAYHAYMKRALERQPGLDIIQDEVTGVLTENGAVTGIKTLLGTYGANNVVIATGTYLGGMIYVGETKCPSGPDSIRAATALTQNLVDLGLPLRRFKTGTPARAHRRSIDFSKLAEQPGDEPPRGYCFMAENAPRNRMECHIAYTNPKTHRVIRENLHRSPLYGGAIEGVGARYCPSIEDKVVRFPDKERHQIFVEPCGEHTDEMYLQGLSSSLPIDVQMALYRTIEGFEHIELMRPAYAIEYDCCDPQALWPTLETKSVAGLFGAGQFNGTSGYEEAAAQGFVAGVNAACRALGREPFILSRQESYIGTLIDDLTTKGTNEPYRMMTSRSEYRLLLRQDNADLRLCEKGRALGLIDDVKYQTFLHNKKLLETQISRLEQTTVPPSEKLDAVLAGKGGAPISTGITLAALLRRPELSYADIRDFDPGKDDAPEAIMRRAEIELKYAGYLKRQQAALARQQKLEDVKLPPALDYSLLSGLRLEAREKLNRVRPLSLGQAARISGVNPADIAVLTVYLKKAEKGQTDD